MVLNQNLNSTLETDINPYYEIRTTIHKGQAMFATRDIPAGAVIVHEKPMIVMPEKIFDSEDSDVIEEWLDKAINRLSCDQRQAFFELTDCRNPMEPSALGIFYTNDMNFDGDAALFPLIARANHSCVPNADFITRVDQGVQNLVALREIKQGEEISLCYLPASCEGAAPRQERQDYMVEWYGFACKCIACCLKGESLVANELVREQVRRVQQVGMDGCSLQELEKFFHNLWVIGVKPPYRREMARALHLRAVLEGDRLFAARLAVEGHEIEAILDQQSEAKRKNDWDADLRTEIVYIGGRGYAFPREV